MIALKIIKHNGFENEVKILLNGVNRALKQPTKVQRPYHLHFTEHPAGGGGLSSIVLRLKSLEHGNHLLVTPETWCTRSDLRKDQTVNLHFLATQCVESTDITASKCFTALKAAGILWALEQETSDIYNDLTSWKALPCAMALHNRLGKDSWLGMMGEDVMKLVFNFVRVE